MGITTGVGMVYLSAHTSMNFNVYVVNLWSVAIVTQPHEYVNKFVQLN